VGWSLDGFADVATFSEPGWEAFVLLVVSENELLRVTVDAGEDAGEFLKWESVLAPQRYPQAARASVGECKLAKVFAGNAELRH
jgi:hypothetical protein